jgi:hypothetical protein
MSKRAGIDVPGEGTGLSRFREGLAEDERTDLDAILLTGEGGYEGLFAYMLVEANIMEGPEAVEGAVFPGETPPFPKALTAP